MPVRMFFHFPELDLVQHHAAFGKGLLHVDEALVAGAAELELERLLRHDKRAVDQDIRKGKQFQKFRLLFPVLLQILLRVTRENHEVLATFLDLASQRDKRRRLVHRVATAERDTVQKRVLVEHRENFLDINKMTPVEIVGLRVLAPGAIVMAPLGKHYHADSGTVHERFGLDTGNPQTRVFVHVTRRASRGRSLRRAWRC